MHCTSGNCGFTIIHDKAAADGLCLACGSPMRRDADDFLLHCAEGLIKNSREGQVRMGRAVEKTLAEKNALLVEGPVGVGKSFAYLIPALLSGKRTIVSTAQKPLQQQLASIDGPRLVNVVKRDVPKASVAILKGKSNYACRLHVDATSDAPEFARWLDHSPTADLSEYTGKRPARIFDVTAEGCIGARCPQANVCAYRNVRKKASEAQVLIVNHALVAFDLRFGPMKLFGEYQSLIVDEAHKAPAAFRGAFEEVISNRGATRILKKMDELRHVALPVSDQLIEATWKDVFKRSSHLEGTLQPDPFGSPGAELYDQLEELRVFVDKHAGVLNRTHAENAEDFESDTGMELSDLPTMLSLSRGLHRTLGALKLLKEPTVNTLLTAEKNMGTHRFKATPISVGALVGDKLAHIPSLVFTSATMTTNGSFADFRRQLGLSRLEAPAAVSLPPTPLPQLGKGASVQGTALGAPKKIEELAVPSPFNYRAQGAFLYIPKHIKGPVSDNASVDPAAREAYLDSIADETLRLVQSSGGQALVLFTATSDLRGVHERLQRDAPEIPWLTQDVDNGQGAEAVLKKFHETPGGVILGLKSFWEGVSIEGDKLWLVVVTKLPFPSPADPLNQAQADQLRKDLTAKGTPANEIAGIIFRTLSMPPMITDIRQGAGRLVRTTTDRGVMAVLDTRVWTGKTGSDPDPKQESPRGYGVTVINALGFKDNWTPDFTYVQAKYKQWRK